MWPKMPFFELTGTFSILRKIILHRMILRKVFEEHQQNQSQKNKENTKIDRPGVLGLRPSTCDGVTQKYIASQRPNYKFSTPSPIIKNVETDFRIIYLQSQILAPASAKSVEKMAAKIGLLYSSRNLRKPHFKYNQTFLPFNFYQNLENSVAPHSSAKWFFRVLRHLNPFLPHNRFLENVQNITLHLLPK